MEKHILINVGRQFGSGGKAVAEELGRILGIPVYDNELLEEAARKSGLYADFFAKRDEKRRAWNIGFGARDAEMFRLQSEAIRDIASRGSAIFVGRASDYVLRDMNCLDVFICAPMEARVERIKERRNLGEDAASNLIVQQDKARSEYYNFFTFTKWGEASNYDLCIDSSILGITGTAEFIVEFARKASLL